MMRQRPALGRSLSDNRHAGRLERAPVSLEVLGPVAEVVEAGRASASRMGTLLAGILPRV